MLNDWIPSSVAKQLHTWVKQFIYHLFLGLFLCALPSFHCNHLPSIAHRLSSTAYRLSSSAHGLLSTAEVSLFLFSRYQACSYFFQILRSIQFDPILFPLCWCVVSVNISRSRCITSWSLNGWNWCLPNFNVIFECLLTLTVLCVTSQTQILKAEIVMLCRPCISYNVMCCHSNFESHIELQGSFWH